MPQKCSGCGAEIPEGSKLGACPKCLLSVGLDAGTQVAGGPEPGVGDRIGPYKLLEKLGEGGCGLVYMAEQQEPIRRRVALKLIKPGMDSREVLARFEVERQALALMDHPNIARIFDAGTTESGRPYFVMELVRGVRITDYCDSHNLSTRERLDLFILVSQAVQHAHQKGIIHRDLKPSNILVTVNDGVPVPKIIDFGIAKATQQALTDKTLFTRFNQLLGTPAYMSPEQAELTSLDIDTRTDIYSLGVLLYELLTGRTPFDSKELFKAGLERMLQIIREREPVRPSARLSTLTAEELTTVASRRQIKGSDLLRLFRGDLDWIVMKCLEKDRGRRYETPVALAADIERHLRKDLVHARPPSTGYRIGRFVQRNQLLVAASSLVIGTLITATVVSLIMAHSARRSQKYAVEEQGKAQRAKEAEENESYHARIGLAQTRIESGAPEQAELLLDGAALRLRNWEWHWLKQCAQAMPKSPGEFIPGIESAAFSRGGTLCVLGEGNGNVVVWDAARSARWVVTTGAHFGTVSVGFTPDDQHIFAARKDHIAFWDLRTSNCVSRFSLATGEVFAASTTGDRIATIVSRPAHDEFSFWDTGSGLSSARLLSTITNQILPGRSRSDTNQLRPEPPRILLSADLRRMFAEPGRVKAHTPPDRSPYDIFSADLQRMFDGLLPVAPNEVALWKARNNFPRDVIICYFGPHDINEALLLQRQLWDTETGHLLVAWPESTLETIPMHRLSFMDNYRLSLMGNANAHFSPDRKKLLMLWPSQTSRFPGARARVYETDSGRQIATWTCGQHTADSFGYDTFGARRIVFSPDGRYIAMTRRFRDRSESKVTVVEVWESNSGRLMAAFKTQLTSREVLAFAPDSIHLIAGVNICDVTSGHVFKGFRPTLRQYPLGTPVLSSDGRRMLTGVGRSRGTSEDGILHTSPSVSWRTFLWELGSSEGLLELGQEGESRHSGLYPAVAAFSPNGRYVACAYVEPYAGLQRPEFTNSILSVYDLSNGREVMTVKTTNRIEDGLIFASEGDRIIVEGQKFIWDQGRITNEVVCYGFPSGAELKRVEAPWLDVTSDGRWIIGRPEPYSFHKDLTNETILQVWDANTGELVAERGGPGQYLEPTSDKRYLVELKPDRAFLEPGSLKVAARIPEGLASPFWLFPSAQRIFAGVVGQEGTNAANEQASFVLVDAKTQRRIASWKVGKLYGEPLILGSSADESRCIIVNRLANWNTAAIIDISTGRRISQLIGHADHISQARFISDGKRVITTSADGMIKLWDADSGRELLSFPAAMTPHGSPIVAVSKDGQRLLTADKDGFVVRSATPGLGATRLSPGHAKTALAPDPKLMMTRYHWRAIDGMEQFQIRLRESQTPPQQLDLSDHYNITTSRDGFTLDAGGEFSRKRNYRLDWLPSWQRTFASVQFDARGMILPEGGKLEPPRMTRPYAPTPGRDIAVGRYSQRVHFLHSAIGIDEEGARSARYLIHYADGATYIVHIVYGEDVRDWMYDPKPLGTSTRSAVAWEGKTKGWQDVRLFKTTWDNPRPAIEITSIDLKSDSKSTVFLVAVTVEDADAPIWTVAGPEEPLR